MAGQQPKGEQVYHGIAVSAGICRGKILVLHRARHIIARRELAENEIAEEVSRFEKALVETRQQILEIQGKVLEKLSSAEADVFEAHLLMLEDQVLVDEVIRSIRDQKVNAEYAFHTVAERYVTALVAANDEYLRERASDMRDVTGRVLNNLFGHPNDVDLRHLTEPCIVISPLTIT